MITNQSHGVSNLNAWSEIADLLNFLLYYRIWQDVAIFLYSVLYTFIFPILIEIRSKDSHVFINKNKYR